MTVNAFGRRVTPGTRAGNKRGASGLGPASNQEMRVAESRPEATAHVPTWRAETRRQVTWTRNGAQTPRRLVSR